MKKEWRAKTFRSGNSVALRLPKATGFVEGDEVVVVPHSDGSFSFWKESNTKQVFMSLSGSVSKSFMAKGRGDIAQDDYEWDNHQTPPRAA